MIGQDFTRRHTDILVGGQSYSYKRLFSEWGGGTALRQEWYIWGLHDWKYMNIGNDFE